MAEKSGDKGKAISRSSPAKRLIRRLLGLSAEAPSPVPVRYFRDQGLPYTRMEFPKGRARDEEIRRWNQEDRRADLAELLADWISLPRARGRIERLKNSLLYRRDRAKAARELVAARSFVFDSPYISDDSWAIEGFLEFGNGSSVALSLINADRFATSIGENFYQTGAGRRFVYNSDEDFAFQPGSSDGYWIVVPDSLWTREALGEEIAAWYIEKFRFTRNHWTHYGEKPQVSVTADFDETPRSS